MQRTVTPPRSRAAGPELAPSPLPSQQRSDGAAGQMEQLSRQRHKTSQWRDKAHRLGDLIVRQEAENLELQRQLGALQRAQAAAVAAAAAAASPGSSTAPPTPGQLEGMRRQLLAAQAQLEKQSEELEAARADYDARQTLLKQAAGAARQEVLALQASNRELRGEADRLSRQAEALAAQLRASQLDRPRSAEELLGSAGPSPAKRHTDAALLQAMLRKKDGELSVLREDSESQQEELMRTLSLLQAAHKREGDLRRQVDNLEGQLDITRDELGQKDAHLELLRERQEEQQDGLRQLRAALVAAEEQATAALAAAQAAAGGTEASEGHVAQLAAEAAALRQRCQREELELEHTRQQLQQRDAEVAQLRLQVPDLRSQLAALRDQLSAAEQTLTAQQAEAAQCQAALQREVEEATAAAAELRAQLETAQAEREQLAAQAAKAAAALERQQQEGSQSAAEAAEERAALQAQAAEQQAALEEQLLAAAERLSAVQQQLEAAEAGRAKLAEQAEEQAAAAQQRDDAAAAVQEQLAAAAADRDAARRQLHRLQGDVSDAEVLLASVLGGASSSSLFSTPPHSPGRARHTPGSSSGCNEAGDSASAAAAVQWLQRQHSASPPPSRAPGAAAGQGAGTSRLCHRIQAVVAEVQRLQAAEQQRQREGTASAVLSPEDSAAAGADDAASPADKLPLLSPVHSDATSGLIAAVHAGAPSQAAAEEGCSLASSPAASSKLKLSLQQEAQQQQQQQSAKARSAAAQQRPRSAGKRQGRPLEALIRTAGLAGIGAALALKLLRPH